MNLQLHQQIDLFIRSLGSFGEGVGSYEGLTFFVEGALPDETVSIQITELKKNYGRGKLLKILTPSPDRATPPCPIFRHCGGCQLMHLGYPKQLEMKRQIVLNALERIGHLKNISIDPCVSSPQELEYRNKIQLPVMMKPDGLTVGLYARNSHIIIPVDHCLIHCEQGENVYQSVLKLLKQSDIAPYDERTGKGVLRHLLIKSALQTSESLVILVTSQEKCTSLQALAQQIMQACPEVKGVIQNINRKRDNVILGTDWHTLAGKSYIREMICDHHFHISPSAFFQVNPAQAESIYQHVLSLADLDKTKTFLDAFCGVGTMTLIAAGQAKECIGIECVPQAIEDANANAQLNQISNAVFYCDHAESKIQSLKDIDVVFLNPPRKGCEESLLNRLKIVKPETILYMSCDPATLARDLKILVQHGYQIEQVTPFDMFPQTAHVETVVKLTLHH
ncbi:23S rRNA (uracil(1939)-C(5))-methyltransferase RlmD [Parachlamydia acanthamoebae]|uniref:23S rRNA (uracil(1939)-C(5))-methyltransferase RlmD n=1 Tax=Parachlamydia acanthamoebae TaxID=83552 RepID=UPI000751627D|nr:23S rRNA (uracil(1939)-C(5))-methyltransferase RlmD [Parachlamydia acanthamoebae]